MKFTGVLFFIVSVLCTTNLSAQYQSMLEDGSEWHHYFWFEASCNHHLVVQGDTMIDGKAYKIIYNLEDICNYQDFVFAREDTIAKQVFVYDSDGIERMLFDYSMTIGDTMAINYSFGTFVLTLDSVSQSLPDYAFCSDAPELFRSQPRVMYLHNVNCVFCQPIVWVEGIGNLADPFYSFKSWSGGNNGDALLCHHDADGLRDFHYVYCEEPEPCTGPFSGTRNIEHRASLEFYPNPTGSDVSISNLDISSDLLMLEWYDSAGRLVRVDREFTGQSIDISGLPIGLLFARMKGRSGAIRFGKLVRY